MMRNAFALSSALPALAKAKRHRNANDWIITLPVLKHSCTRHSRKRHPGKAYRAGLALRPARWQHWQEDENLEIDLVFKIAAIGIIVAVLNQLLIRSGREDQAMMTTLAGLVVVLSILVKQISALFVTIKSLFAL